MVIHSHMQGFPAHAGSTLPPISGGAMANNSDSGQLFDIQMKQISR
jgi:hypothetical protein